MVSIAGFVINILHSIAMSQLRFNRRQTGNHIKAFVWCMIVADLMVTALRSVLSNQRAQNVLGELRVLCIASAILHHAYAMIDINLLTYFCADRAHSAYCSSNAYWNSQRVRYAKATLVWLMICPLIVFTTMGIVFRDVGFMVKGIGTCQMETPAIPYLGLPSAGYCITCLTIMLILAYIAIYRTQKRLHTLTASQRVNRTSLNRMMTSWCAITLYTWIAPVVMLFMRFMRYDCEYCQLFALIQFSLGAVLNPVIVGVNLPGYRQYLRRVIRRKRVGTLHSTNSRNHLTINQSTINMRIMERVLERIGSINWA